MSCEGWSRTIAAAMERALYSCSPILVRASILMRLAARRAHVHGTHSKDRGDMRFARRARGLTMTLAIVMGLGGSPLLFGCSNPQATVSSCVGVPDKVLNDIGSRLDVAGSLRNGREVPGKAGAPSFVSAELHRKGTRDKSHGDILTFATDDAGAGQFLAVDQYARTTTSWPHAAFDVQRTSAMESRACADSVKGLTRTQARCLARQQSQDVQAAGSCD